MIQSLGVVKNIAKNIEKVQKVVETNMDNLSPDELKKATSEFKSEPDYAYLNHLLSLFKKKYGHDLRGYDSVEFLQRMKDFENEISVYEFQGVDEADDLPNRQCWENYFLMIQRLSDDFAKEKFDIFGVTQDYTARFYFSPNFFDFVVDTERLFTGDNIFMISDVHAELLLNYRNRKHPIVLPQKRFFLDTSLIINDVSIRGIFVEEVPTGIRFFFVDDNLLKLESKVKLTKEIYSKVEEFIYNFCDFIVAKSIKWNVIPANKKRDERRATKGKKPIPTFHKTFITGILQRHYEENEEHKARGEIIGRYHVRRFLRHFWDKERFRKLYMLWDEGKLQINRNREWYMGNDGVLSCVIKEQIRGKGELKKQVYELK